MSMYSFCSLQGAAVVLTPAYCDTQITSPVTVNVEVVFGNGRDSKSSEPIEFTYKPSPKLQVQEVEMLPNLPDPADTFLPMEMYNSIGDIVMNGLTTHQQTLHPSAAAPVPAPVPVLPQVNDEQGMSLYQKKLVSSDWLKGVQFSCNTSAYFYWVVIELINDQRFKNWFSKERVE